MVWSASASSLSSVYETGLELFYVTNVCVCGHPVQLYLDYTFVSVTMRCARKTMGQCDSCTNCLYVGNEQILLPEYSTSIRKFLPHVRMRCIPPITRVLLRMNFFILNENPWLRNTFEKWLVVLMNIAKHDVCNEWFYSTVYKDTANCDVIRSFEYANAIRK